MVEENKLNLGENDKLPSVRENDMYKLHVDLLIHGHINQVNYDTLFSPQKQKTPVLFDVYTKQYVV